VAAWTTRSLLQWTTQDFKNLDIATARLDAELLLAYALGVDRVQLYMDMDRPLSAAELQRMRELVTRRRRREPVAYLTGHKEFYLREFQVTRAVLVPRPDTECLVERALALIPADTPLRVLDLCTGSGIIAITLAAERPAIQGVATDLSEAALAVARDNALRVGVDSRMRFELGDLFAALSEPTRFDLVVANPPYLRAGELTELAPELRHEPEEALVSDQDGLGVLKRLCTEVSEWLVPQGTALFEIGANQADAVLALLAENPKLTALTSHRDLGGVTRVVEARSRASEE